MDQLLSSQPLEDASTAPRWPRLPAATTPVHVDPLRTGQALHTAPSLLLTRDELESLTGTKQPKRMAAWLHSHNWVHELPARRGDIPKVDRMYYHARMSGASPSGARRSGPHLDWMLQRP